MIYTPRTQRLCGDFLIISQLHHPAVKLTASEAVLEYSTAVRWGAEMLSGDGAGHSGAGHPAVRAGEGEMAMRESRWLLEAAAVSAGRDPLFIRDTVLTTRTGAVFRSHIARRARGEPLAYVIGEACFCGFDLYVTSDVLIPRPETEQLVELALKNIPVDSSARILDQGTGSGAIAIAIALSRPKVTIDAVDISQSAVDIARRNVERHGLQDRVNVIQADLYPYPLDPVAPVESDHELMISKTTKKYDCVVANLPYVADDAEVADDVGEWEPALALRGGKTGRELIERSIEMAVKNGAGHSGHSGHGRHAGHVADDGLLIYEIGDDQREGFESRFNDRIKFRADLAGKIRFMLVRIGSAHHG